jgi:hypothetical protein
MALAKVKEVKHPQLVLAELADKKSVRVSVAVNATTPAVGADIEIGPVTESKRPAPGKDSVSVLDANMIGLAPARAK